MCSRCQITPLDLNHSVDVIQNNNNNNSYNKNNNNINNNNNNNHYYNKTVEWIRLIISTHETSEGVISLKSDLNFYILMVVI